MFMITANVIVTFIKALAGAYKPRKHCNGCSCEHHDDSEDLR